MDIGDMKFIMVILFIPWVCGISSTYWSTRLVNDTDVVEGSIFKNMTALSLLECILSCSGYDACTVVSIRNIHSEKICHLIGNSSKRNSKSNLIINDSRRNGHKLYKREVYYPSKVNYSFEVNVKEGDSGTRLATTTTDKHDCKCDKIPWISDNVRCLVFHISLSNKVVTTIAISKGGSEYIINSKTTECDVGVIVLSSMEGRMFWSSFHPGDKGLFAMCLDGTQKRKLYNGRVGSVAIDRLRGILIYNAALGNTPNYKYLKTTRTNGSQTRCIYETLHGRIMVVTADPEDGVAYFDVGKFRNIIYSIAYTETKPKAKEVVENPSSYFIFSFLQIDKEKHFAWFNRKEGIQVYSIRRRRVRLLNMLSECQFIQMQGLGSELYVLCGKKICIVDFNRNGNFVHKIKPRRLKTTRYKYAIG